MARFVLKTALHLWIWFFSVQVLLANAAMPGFWNIGAGKTFVPLRIADSIYFDKVAMQKEAITIHLYKGYAVVKGQYTMYNTSTQPITMLTGYPKSGEMPHPEVENIIYDDSLHAMKVLVNGVVQRHRYERVDPALADSEWYVWETTFAPKRTTEITVYFIVNTSDAVLREGYNTEGSCGFGYILESGAAWHGQIESGRIFVRLQDGLKEGDIIGVLPDNRFVSNGEGILVYDFKKLEPSSVDNILIRYYEDIDEEFNMSPVVQQSAALYSKLDKENNRQVLNEDFLAVGKSDFEVANSFGWFILGFLLLLLLVSVGIIWLVVWFVRKVATGARENKKG